MSSTTITTITKPKKQPGRQRTVTVRRTKRNRRRRPRVPRNVVAGGVGASQYLQTLYDPWEHGPIRLGYDTFTPTVMATAYLREALTVNADGSFAIVMFDQLTGSSGAGGIATNVAGATTATWTGHAASNIGAIINQVGQARFVSGGLRAIALFPATSAPGVLFAGQLLSTSPNSLVSSYTPNSLSTLPSSIIGVGSSGARAVMLPIDPESFHFTYANVTGSDSVVCSSSNPYIVGLGFPPGTIVWYEAIWNIEGLAKDQNTSSGLSADSAPQPSLADIFPTPRQAFQAIASLMPSSVIMDAALHTLSGASATDVAKRTALGVGRNLMASLVAGASSSARSRDMEYVFEEMASSSGQLARTRIR